MAPAARISPRSPPWSIAANSSRLLVCTGILAARVPNDLSSRAVSGSGVGRRKRPPSSSVPSNTGSSIRASGLPPVCSCNCARTAGASCRPCASRSDLAAASSRPPSVSSGSPASSKKLSMLSRLAMSTTIRSCSTRRATKASTSAEERSSQCASSITTSREVGWAASDNSSSTASAIKNRSGASAASSIPKAVKSAARCGLGSRSACASIGHTSWCNPANGSGASDCTPVALSTRIPVSSARRQAASSRVDLPIPGSPRMSNTAPRSATPSTSSSSRANSYSRP